MASGTYTLVIDLAADARIGVGALGEREFPAGTYGYTGTAFGPGGFSRIDRHREVAAGTRDVRHWHVDYLLGHPGTELVAAFCTPDRDAECAVTGDLAGERVPEFGATDCDCPSHLVRTDDRSSLVASAREVHERRRD